MSLIRRSLRYVRALGSIRSLDRRTAVLIDDPRALIRETFQYCDAFLQPIQLEDEIVHLVEDVRQLQPKTVLEIGTSMGGTLYLWTRLATSDALLISVDLPGGKFGGGYSPLRTPLYKGFARQNQTVRLIRGDSHSPEILNRVKEFLGPRQVDLLFIDGDHTFEGVSRDWALYSPLVRSQGIIAFHDVASNYADTEVKRFWDRIKPQYTHREYIARPGGHYGIGLLWQK